MRWRIAPGQTLRQRVWQDEGVIYNNLSGDTHLLGAAALELLQMLQEAPASTAELVQAAGTDLPANFNDELDMLLGELRALSLIESD